MRQAHVDYGFVSCGCSGCRRIFDEVGRPQFVLGADDRELLDRLLAAHGAFRQDMGALVAAVGRLEEIVYQMASQGGCSDFCSVPGCNCHIREPGL